MKNAYVYLLGILLLGWGSVCAQTQGGDGNNTVLDILDPTMMNNALVFDRRYPKIEGSPYVLKDWATGVIYRKVGAPLESLTLHFDIYTQELLVMQEQKVMTVAPAALKGFKLYRLEEADMVFYQNANIEENKFFQQVYQGEYEIWKGFEVALAKQDNNSGGYGQSGNSPEVRRFNRKEIWYLIRPGETEPLMFKATKKDLLGLFPNRSSEIKTYLKEKKLKLSQDQDWITVMKFLEQNTSDNEG